MAIKPKEISRILHSKTGHNTIFDVAVAGGETTPVMIVDWQNDPIKETLLHIDLKRIDLTRRLRVKIPIHTIGEPKGVKLQGGLHELITREIEIECLPDEIPEVFTVEVGELMIGVLAELRRNRPRNRFSPLRSVISSGCAAKCWSTKSNSCRSPSTGSIRSTSRRISSWRSSPITCSSTAT